MRALFYSLAYLIPAAAALGQFGQLLDMAHAIRVLCVFADLR